VDKVIEEVDDQYYFNFYGWFLKEDIIIIKKSINLIDVINIDDIVNGEKVIEAEYPYLKFCCDTIFENEIKDIMTYSEYKICCNFLLRNTMKI
jgi:hypothetical protein